MTSHLNAQLGAELSNGGTDCSDWPTCAARIAPAALPAASLTRANLRVPLRGLRGNHRGDHTLDLVTCRSRCRVLRFARDGRRIPSRIIRTRPKPRSSSSSTRCTIAGSRTRISRAAAKPKRTSPPSARRGEGRGRRQGPAREKEDHLGPRRPTGGPRSLPRDTWRSACSSRSQTCPEGPRSDPGLRRLRRPMRL